ncbi:MAG: ATP-binding cassette domain-containing protein [Acetobacteraceae bacterium]
MTSASLLSGGPNAAADVLSVRDVSKTYSSGRVLNNVSLTCRAGEVRALVGENGAGKSTLVKILSGAIPPDAGMIRLHGQEVRFRGPLDALGKGVGVVYQELTLLDNLRAGENVLLGQEPVFPGGILKLGELRQTSAALLRMVGLPDRPERQIDTMAIAQKHLLEVAKAISRHLSLLILDEPTSALGDRQREPLFRLIDTLKKQGLAIIYISHHLDEVLTIADTVTVLKDGVVIADVATGELNEQDLIRHMVGRDVVQSAATPDAPAAADAVALRASGLSGSGFSDVSFAVHRREIIGFAGLLGSGTINVAEALVGVRPALSGRITRDDRPIRIRTPADASRHGIVFVPEDRKRDGLALGRTAAENITMGVLTNLQSGGMLSLRSEREVAVRTAREVSLAERFLDRECRFLSGGQQQKVLLGRCLAARSDVLVVAEPTRGVDVGARAEIYTILRRLAARGTAIVVVSSDTRELAELCDRILIFGAGRMTGEMPRGALTREAIMAAVSAAAGPASRTSQAAPLAEASPAKEGYSATFLSEAIPAVAFILIAGMFAISSRYFLTGQNLQDLERQAVVLGLAAFGQMMVILTGGIDLSIGATATMANMVSAQLLMSYGPASAIAGTFLMGACVGAGNALLVRARFPSFLATYAVSLVIAGLSLAWFPHSVGPVPKYFWVLSSAEIGPIPAATLILLLIFGAGWFVLWRTALGRHLFAFGRDPEAARLSGVRTIYVLLAAYVISGVASAAIGVFLTARIGAGLPRSGQGLELEAIAAVMLGGANLFGGRVTIGGTLAGTGVLTILANGFNLLRVDPFYTGILRGAVMLVVVGVWAFAEHHRATHPRQAAFA